MQISIKPRRLDKMLNLIAELSWEDQKFLRLMEKERQRRVAIISYHFHFEKEINIGQTTGYKQKCGYMVQREGS